MASSNRPSMAASLQSTTCSECGLGLNGLGLKLKCMHSICLQCLQNIFNDDQIIKCKLCQEDPNEAPTSKPGISSEYSVLDVADHIIIEENFVLKLTTKNHSGNDEYDKGLNITCKLTSPSVSGDDKHIRKHINVEDNQDGTYNLSGCCDVDGEWELECYVNGMQIRQSPLKLNVVKGGLQDIPNIFREKKDVGLCMFDIVDDSIYACGGMNEIMKFTLKGKGELIGTIYGPKSSQFTSLCCANVKGDLSIVCYDAESKTLRIYNKETWRECKDITIGSVLGKMISHDDKIYVPDYGKHCVLCISMEGKLLEKIESKNYRNVKLSKPYGVAITQKGNVLVISYTHDHLLMFAKEDHKAKVLIKNGTTDGKVHYPYAVVVDERDQIIVGSWGKLQLFNKDGKFIKNIDKQKNLPVRPYSIFCKNRRLWVADGNDFSLRLYNY